MITNEYLYWKKLFEILDPPPILGWLLRFQYSRLLGVHRFKCTQFGLVFAFVIHSDVENLVQVGSKAYNFHFCLPNALHFGRLVFLISSFTKAHTVSVQNMIQSMYIFFFFLLFPTFWVVGFYISTLLGVHRLRIQNLVQVGLVVNNFHFCPPLHFGLLVFVSYCIVSGTKYVWKISARSDNKKWIEIRIQIQNQENIRRTLIVK